MPTPDHRRVDEVKILQGQWRDKAGNQWDVSEYKAVVRLVEGGRQVHMFEIFPAGRVGLLSSRIMGVQEGCIKWSDGDQWERKPQGPKEGEMVTAQTAAAWQEVTRLNMIVNEKDKVIADLREQLTDALKSGRGYQKVADAAAASQPVEAVPYQPYVPHSVALARGGKPHPPQQQSQPQPPQQQPVQYLPYTAQQVTEAEIMLDARVGRASSIPPPSYRTRTRSSSMTRPGAREELAILQQEQAEKRARHQQHLQLQLQSATAASQQAASQQMILHGGADPSQQPQHQAGQPHELLRTVPKGPTDVLSPIEQRRLKMGMLSKGLPKGM